jgi:hypothetical protein
VKANNSCAETLIFGSFFFIIFYQFFFFFSSLFTFFLLSILFSFLLLSNWFLFLSSFVFPLLFRHCFIPVSLDHVVSSLAYPNLLRSKRLGGCCHNKNHPEASTFCSNRCPWLLQHFSSKNQPLQYQTSPLTFWHITIMS